MSLLNEKLITSLVASLLLHGSAVAQSRAPVVGKLPSKAYEQRGMENERCRQHQQRLDDAAARNGTRPFVAECMRDMAEERDLARIERQKPKEEPASSLRNFTVIRDGQTYYCQALGQQVTCHQ